MTKTLLPVFLLITQLVFAAQINVKKQTFSQPPDQMFDTAPSLVLNERTGALLSIWERHPGNHPNHSTYARPLTPKGRAKGTRTLVSGTNSYSPSAAYNRAGNEYVLVYADERGNSLFAVYAQRLDSRGRKKGDPVKISPDDVNGGVINDHPRIIFNAANRTYNVVWQRSPTQQSSTITGGLYGLVLGEDLQIVRQPVLLREAPVVNGFRNFSVVTDLAFHPVSGKLLIGYYRYQSGIGTTSARKHFYVGAVDADLQGVAASNFSRVSKKTVKNGFDLKFGILSDSAFVVYTGPKNLRRQNISADGKPVGKSKPAFGGALATRRLDSPAIAFDGSGGGLLVAIEDGFQSGGNGKIWAQPLDATGAPAGDPENVDEEFTAASQLSLAFLPRGSTNAIKRYALLYVNGAQITIPPLPGESSNLTYLKLSLTAEN